MEPIIRSNALKEKKDLIKIKLTTLKINENRNIDLTSTEKYPEDSLYTDCQKSVPGEVGTFCRFVKIYA